MLSQESKQATFLIGESETESIQVNEKTLSGIITSGSSLTGTKMTFLVSIDGTNFYPLFNSANEEVSITLDSSAKAYYLDYTVFIPWLFVKGRLGTSASPVVQTVVDQKIILIIESM